MIHENMMKVLKHELVKALGCTEPIALAYVSAVARKVLKEEPDWIEVGCSGNMIKNAKSVIVPMTGHLKGIEAAVISGMVGGNSDKQLEVLTDMTEDDVRKVQKLLDRRICKVKCLDSSEKLHIIVKMGNKDNTVCVELKRSHLGIVKVERNDEVLYEVEPIKEEELDDYNILNVSTILEFANTVPIEEVRPFIDEQIDCNTRIAEVGLKEDYGANIGKTLLKYYGNDVKVRAKAYAAAGSDARMNGCELPVVINSGSGNQGMTVSLPVVEFAKELKVSHEKLVRALVLSNLIAIYQKYRIGKLSAYCGVVSAAAGAGAGITYLYDGTQKEIENTVINTVGNISGIICDGACSSCAAKIASSVDAAIMGSVMARNGSVFEDGDGIVKENLQKTLDGVVELARDGMKETDEVILNIMVNE